jgi:methylase of polypeptide subunit release factors
MSFYNTVTYGSISVFYFDDIDGGGAGFGQDYLSFIPKRVGKVDRILEWCAGPGFIGFSMLAAGLCNQLTLLDINPDATAACRQTIAHNNLERVVQVYTSDCMDALKQGDKFDLIVANPPHCGDTTPHHRGKSTLIYNDVGWHIHRRFYNQASSHITPESRIIIECRGLQANDRGISPRTRRYVPMHIGEEILLHRKSPLNRPVAYITPISNSC